MAYKISFWKGAREVSSKLWPCSLDAATAHALARFPQQHNQQGATSVTVANERTGKIVFAFAGTDCSPIERRRLELGLSPRVMLSFKERMPVAG